MAYMIAPTIGVVDQLGYAYCSPCVIDRFDSGDALELLADIAGDNCAFEDVDCDACGERFPFDRRRMILVTEDRPFKGER